MAKRAGRKAPVTDRFRPTVTLHGVDGYMNDMATGHAVFVRTVVDVDDQQVKAYNRIDGSLIGRASIVDVCSGGILHDLHDEPRFHVDYKVRMMCLDSKGLRPAIHR